MRVAVQGCSHGALDEIYQTVNSYTETTSNVVDLLLLCGDFQALRSKHDFASLAVPPKYFALGAFHEYYSGKKVAPVLTLVIGGNHEASNYMWELYYGGWLAPNIYYLGNTGCVQVDGLRVMGMSGIYKSGDYNKGHYEKMPLDKSTMRSIYHIRNYDLMKIKQLPITSPSIALSHDWPAGIYYHGDTKRLIRNKPFFDQEIKTNTLGSPPLFDVLRRVKPDYWFSAHLHVKFAAVYDHGDAVVPVAGTEPVMAENPDEIVIGDEDDDEGGETIQATSNPDEIEIGDEDEDQNQDQLPAATASGNPDEINIGDSEIEDITVPSPMFTNQPTASEAKEALKVDESVDFVEAVRVQEGNKEAYREVVAAESGPSGTSSEIPTASSSTTNDKDKGSASDQRSSSTGRQTKFLALDKVLPGRDFIQFLDIPTPEPTFNHRPRMTFDPHWLAITRAMQPYLSLGLREIDPPMRDLPGMIERELDQIQSQGLLVPETLKEGQGPTPVPALVWERGLIDVDRVQKFWPTAPAHGEAGGSDTAWYTNPQTEAFCGMLGIENKINPAPR